MYTDHDYNQPKNCEVSNDSLENSYSWGNREKIKAERDEFFIEVMTACNREVLDFINQNTSYEKHPLLSQQPHEVLLPCAGTWSSEWWWGASISIGLVDQVSSGSSHGSEVMTCMGNFLDSRTSAAGGGCLQPAAHQSCSGPSISGAAGASAGALPGRWTL